MRDLSGKQYKDEVYGSVTLDELQWKLLHTAAVEQTRNITQLGLARYIYSAADHERIQHNMGAGILAGKYADALKLGDTERFTLEAAATLHDIGHPAFSHAAGRYFKERWSCTQESLSRKKILEDAEINRILVEFGVNPAKLAELIFDDKFFERYHGRQRFLKQLTAGSMDVDRIDYLIRDSRRTAPFGQAVDYQRFLQCARRVDDVELGDIVLYDEDCLPALQAYFAVYHAMYRAVYYNPNVKATEALFERALFLAHEYLAEKFKQYRTDPSCIPEDELIDTLLSMPIDNKRLKVAHEIAHILFDKETRRQIKDVAFLRIGYQQDELIARRLSEKYPVTEQGDSLEAHLIKNVPAAQEGEIIVIRNTPREEKTDADVFVYL